MTVFFLPKKFRPENLPSVAAELAWLQTILREDFPSSFSGNATAALAAAGVIESVAYLRDGDLDADEIGAAAEKASALSKEDERIVDFVRLLAGLWFEVEEGANALSEEVLGKVRKSVRNALKENREGKNPRRLLANAALGFMTRPEMAEYRKKLGIGE